MPNLVGIETGNFSANKERSLLPKLLPNTAVRPVIETYGERRNQRKCLMI
jgi:hypothetical protein